MTSVVEDAVLKDEDRFAGDLQLARSHMPDELIELALIHPAVAGVQLGDRLGKGLVKHQRPGAVVLTPELEESVAIDPFRVGLWFPCSSAGAN